VAATVEAPDGIVRRWIGTSIGRSSARHHVEFCAIATVGGCGAERLERPRSGPPAFGLRCCDKPEPVTGPCGIRASASLRHPRASGEGRIVRIRQVGSGCGNRVTAGLGCCPPARIRCGRIFGGLATRAWGPGVVSTHGAVAGALRRASRAASRWMRLRASWTARRRVLGCGPLIGSRTFHQELFSAAGRLFLAGVGFPNGSETGHPAAVTFLHGLSRRGGRCFDIDGTRRESGCEGFGFLAFETARGTVFRESGDRSGFTPAKLPRGK